MREVTPEEIYQLIYEIHNDPNVHVLDMIHSAAVVHIDLLEYAGEKATCGKLSQIFMNFKEEILRTHMKYAKEISDHTRSHLH